jgi:hypothetical protein
LVLRQKLMMFSFYFEKKTYNLSFDDFSWTFHVMV